MLRGWLGQAINSGWKGSGEAIQRAQTKSIPPQDPAYAGTGKGAFGYGKAYLSQFLFTGTSRSFVAFPHTTGICPCDLTVWTTNKPLCPTCTTTIFGTSAYCTGTKNLSRKTCNCCTTLATEKSLQ